MTRARTAWLLCTAVAACDAHRVAQTSYSAELAQLEQKVVEARKLGSEQDGSRQMRGRLAYALYARASLTGDFAQFHEAEEQLSAALTAFPDDAELLLLEADLDIKMHRFEPALRDLHRLTKMVPSTELVPRFADIALQYGYYEETLALYDHLVAANPSWDNLARLAFFKAHTGDTATARELYRRAQEKLSVHEMRNFAWLELQTGVIDLEERDYKAALAHFETAERVYSGYWLIEEHIAEASNLLGDRRRAAEVYDRVVKYAPHSDIIFAFAKVSRAADPDRASTLMDWAERSFAEDAALFPEAAMGHHLVQLLETGTDPAATLRLAKDNHTLRPNAESKALLARAYFAVGDRASAEVLIHEISAMPWRAPAIEQLLESSTGSSDRSRGAPQ